MKAPRFEAQTLPRPPGIIGSLRAGFDVIAAHITAILMPLGLDLLLWLGPRLSVDQIAQPLLKDLGALATSSGLQPDDVRAALDVYRQFFKEFNLLVVLRTFPIGISSLMSGRLPTQSPLGPEAAIQIQSPGLLLGLIFLFTLAGWMLGGMYFHWVATLVDSGAAMEGPAHAGRAITQTLLYSALCAVLAWTLGLPIIFGISVLFAINALVGEGVLLFVGFIFLWLVVPIFFSPHGIFVRRQNAFASFLGGFQMARFTLPTSSMFVLTIFLIGVGLNFLWSMPTYDSWLALVGILGHAFITTALLASSFVYYHDMTAWVQTVLAQLRAGMPPQQA